MLSELILVVFSAVFVNNILLSQYLGNCPFCGVSKNISSATGMGLSVLFVLTISSTFCWIFRHFFLEPFNLEWLQTIVFILLIATLVQFIEMFLQKNSPLLYRSLGIYLPLITTNCAVLGVALLAIKNNYNFITTIIYSFSSGIGFMLALLCMAGIRQKLAMSPVPSFFRGTAITLVIAGIMALAFLGFSGVDETLNNLIKK